MVTNKFEQILLEAIDQALSSLGERAKESIYFHMEMEYKIARQEIPNRINDFSDSLERIFGLGALHLEVLFMKNLYTKVQVTCKKPTSGWPSSERIVQDITFQEYVRLMRQNFEAANNSEVEIGILTNEHEELQK